MTDEEKELLYNDPDFILSKRHRNSLGEVKKNYGGEVPEAVASSCLGITQKELKREYARIVEILKEKIRAI